MSSISMGFSPTFITWAPMASKTMRWLHTAVQTAWTTALKSFAANWLGSSSKKSFNLRPEEIGRAKSETVTLLGRS